VAQQGRWEQRGRQEQRGEQHGPREQRGRRARRWRRVQSRASRHCCLRSLYVGLVDEVVAQHGLEQQGDR